MSKDITDEISSIVDKLFTGFMEEMEKLNAQPEDIAAALSMLSCAALVLMGRLSSYPSFSRDHREYFVDFVEKMLKVVTEALIQADKTNRGAL